nr:hypothetical protein [Legionella tunisiensis]
MIAETNGCAQVIIGIGINVNTATQYEILIGRPWCSLYEITGHHFDRNIILANLIYQLDRHLEQFLQNGFAAFSAQWQSVDYLFGKQIAVTQPNGVVAGRACGVNELGQLALKDEEGTLHYLSAGDTSLHK